MKIKERFILEVELTAREHQEIVRKANRTGKDVQSYAQESVRVFLRKGVQTPA